MRQIILNEENLRKIIRETLNGLSEKIVKQFTPYTEKERERNFSPFTNKDKRTPYERNPSYEKAVRDAEERMRMRKLSKDK